MIGTLDPSSGAQNLQGYDKTLEGILAQVQGSKDVARINGQNRGGGAAQPKYDMTVNPKTGTIVYIAPNQPPFDTGIPAQSPQGQQMLSPKDIASMYEAFERGQGNRFPGEERPENPFFPIVQSLLPNLSGQGNDTNSSYPGLYAPREKGLLGMISPVILNDMRKSYSDDEIRSWFLNGGNRRSGPSR